MSTSKTKLDAGLVRELAAILREADLGEVEVEHEGLRIRVSKATSMAPAAPTYVQAPAAAPVVVRNRCNMAKDGEAELGPCRWAARPGLLSVQR